MTKIFDRFITEITGLKMTIETIDEHLPEKFAEDIKRCKDALLLELYLQQKFTKKVDPKLSQMFDGFITITKVDKKSKMLAYSIDNSKKPQNMILNIEESHKIYEKAARTMRTTYNSFLVTALIIFETAISSLLKKIISKYSDIYLKDDEIKISKLLKFNDIGKLKEQLINNKVDEIMHQNVFEWLNLLKAKQKVNIEYDEKSKQFLEGYYRRNVIVHNNGIVNNEYLERIDALGISTNIKLGDAVDCSQTYINDFIDSSIYMLINIMYESTKLFKDEIDDFLDEIEDYAVNQISNQKYDLSTLIFKKLSEKNISDEQHMIYIKINYWQSKKWNNQFKDVEEEVKRFDVSAKDDYIKLGKYALLDDFDSMITIVRTMSKNTDSVEKLNYTLEEWPIFKKFKESEQYKAFVNEEKIINTSRSIENDTKYQETQKLIDTFETDNKN